MIHIATVHWEQDIWIDIQLTYFKKFIQEEYRTYAFLNHLPEDHSNKFYYSSNEPIKEHSIKLNLLADIICFAAEREDDILIFIDGDAFPVGDILSFGRKKLNDFPLIAIQRRENRGDIQPHPAFCMTTVGFWKKIKGDWAKGYQWQNNQGKFVSDIGGNLLGILTQKQIQWHPLLRSNKKNIHPVFFGIYEGLIYHHGSGFRNGSSRQFAHDKKKELRRKPFSRMYDQLLRIAFGRGRLRKYYYKYSPKAALKRQAVTESQDLSLSLYNTIKQNLFFFKDL